ncbi:MAG TPA: hypothetical protein VJ798_08010 [Rhizomicrobium sp.]|nr:hypothetical protein [Rhizomicrobium sp.]
MGDRSHSELYGKLLDFLEQHGRPLESEGVAERGLAEDKALEFINLLETSGAPILGLEVWRHLGRRYDLDITTIWYSESQPHQEYNSARSALRGAVAGPKI